MAIYAARQLGERAAMQNSSLAGERAGPDHRAISVQDIASPKVVMLAAGTLALVVDLFVRPVTPVGLALIVLATSPWIVQAWSERPARPRAPAAASPARPEPARSAIARPDHTRAEPAPQPRPAPAQAAPPRRAIDDRAPARQPQATAPNLRSP